MKNFTKMLCLLLSLVLCISLFAGCDLKKADEPAQETEAPASENTEALQGGDYGNNKATALESYSITEAAPGDANMAAAVAVDGEGQPVVTNAQLQFFFWEAFYQMQQDYGEYYLTMMGLDPSTPLSQQSSLMENYTWEQYFLETATNTLTNFHALASGARAEGFQLTEGDLETLAYYTETDGEFAQEVIAAGYESVDAYLTDFYGAGVSMEDYADYLETYLMAMAYYNDVLYVPVADALTDAEIEAYYDENAETLEGEGHQKVNNVSVRHILIQPVGDADIETGDYSEEQWAETEAEAQRVYEMWLENPTEEYFAELANDHSTDGGSNTTGGLYEDFKPGQMVEEFNDWSFDQSRQPGDHGIVRTTYGYHIMYFVEQTETRVWYDTVKDTIANNAASEVLERLKETYAVKYDFTMVRIFDVIAVNAAQEPQTEEEN